MMKLLQTLVLTIQVGYIKFQKNKNNQNYD
jgi:hypothetical protein